jgi:hypothetical protein
MNQDDWGPIPSVAVAETNALDVEEWSRGRIPTFGAAGNEVVNESEGSDGKGCQAPTCATSASTIDYSVPCYQTPELCVAA